MLTSADLHLAVDDPRVVALAVDVVHLGEVVLLPQQRVQDVVLTQDSEVQYSTVQYSTVQYSTVQYST